MASFHCYLWKPFLVIQIEGNVIILYKLLVFMRSLTKCNLPNMNHPDKNSLSNNKLLWWKKCLYL